MTTDPKEASLDEVCGDVPGHRANARLIAAGPELLEVCQRIAKTSPVVRDADYNALIAAINKATGQSLPLLSEASRG